MTLFLKMGDFRPLRGRGKGGRVPILSHPYGVFCHAFQIMSQGVYGCYNNSIAKYIHYWQFYNLIFVRIQAIIWNLMNRGHVYLTN